MGRWLLVLIVMAAALSACDESESSLPRLEFSQFGDPADSAYCLPYPVGQTWTLNNSYSTEGSHRGRFAYDFFMPVGSEVTATRDGRVTETRGQYRDDDPAGGHENGVFVLHEDGTMAAYLHFTEAGVFVEVGDEVVTGEVLGLVGTSGTSPANPHLHFEVWEQQNPQWYQSLPVNFRNAVGPLDLSNGLVTDASYEAVDCPPAP